jgi:hydroxymethylpyrimidine pyrophosphatase-like HAD family hydrolase
MKSAIQVICTDFDGTVFSEFEHQPIPPRLVQLIAQAQSEGAKWVINTGRDMSSLMEALGRSRIPIHPDYLVLVEREIYEHSGLAYRGLHRWNDACQDEHNHLFREVRPEVSALGAWISRHHRATIYEDAFSPFCVIAESGEAADHIHEFLEDFATQIPCLSVVRNDIYMRFAHNSYNKGTALTEICEIEGVSPEDTFVAGDHFNDLPMLQRKRAAWLAAPVNAIPAVQDTVREQGGFLSRFTAGDGVADAIEWCLSETHVEAQRRVG